MHITNEKNVWDIVIEKRKSLLLNHSYIECESNVWGSNPSLLPDNMIIENIEYIVSELKLNVTRDTIKDVSNKTFNDAADVFTYLNYCPPKLLIAFYEDLIKTASSRNIILAMTSLMKTSKNAEKRSSNRIFSKIMEKLDLSNYEIIQILTKGKCYKEGVYRNCTKYIDLYNGIDSAGWLEYLIHLVPFNKKQKYF